MGVFDADIAAANDDNAFRPFPEVEYVFIGQIADLTEALDRRDEGAGSIISISGRSITIATASHLPAKDPVFVAHIGENHREENDNHGEHEDQGIG